jgi:hypothetical protein
MVSCSELLTELLTEPLTELTTDYPVQFHATVWPISKTDLELMLRVVQPQKNPTQQQHLIAAMRLPIL